MKRALLERAVALLLVAAASVVGTIPASAQRENRSIGENGREARKAAKQQQKASSKMAKKQRKAAKKYQKQQRKLQNHRTR
jgi:hypothetical protein